MKNHGTVQLETSRLILRKFVLEDVEQSYINWASDYETSKYFAFYPHKEKSDTENIIKQWINAYQCYLFIKEDYYLIEAKYNSTNIVSGKLLQKVGMKQDGILRDRRLDKETGKRNDLVICSIKKSEYLQML